VAPLSEIFLKELLGKHIKKPKVDTIQHRIKELEPEILKANVEDVEDIESRSQTTTARDVRYLLQVSHLDCVGLIN
jgi:hypothetical protein